VRDYVQRSGFFADEYITFSRRVDVSAERLL
jgi:hypothetical protein